MGSPNLCDHCQIKPKHFDGVRTHPYCGKTCAAHAKSAGQIQSNGATQSSYCIQCHAKPKYNDGAVIHPYCGKKCAAIDARKGTQRTTSPAKPVNVQLCTIPGCARPAYKDPNGISGSFCSKGHKELSEDACLWCRKAVKKGGHFCSRTCGKDAQLSAPSILEVPEGHATFKSVTEQFTKSWRHAGKKCPPVRLVYKVMSTQASLHQYEAYRDSVEAQGNFKASGRSLGNENRRWHGTRRECNLGDKGQKQLCNNPGCSLCCIIRTSFDLACFGNKTHWGRFGKGLYTSSTSSKSDDYSNNIAPSNFKAILLNKVVVGKGHKLLLDNPTLTAPPAGHHSVLAEKGGALNHDELVVYTNDAIRPSFLVMYEP